MLKVLGCLVTSAVIGLSVFPRVAVAERLSSSQCRNREMRAVQYIQSRSPVIGSYNYHNYWTRTVPSYLIRLENMNPECSFWDQREWTSDDYERMREFGEAQVERMQENSERVR